MAFRAPTVKRESRPKQTHGVTAPPASPFSHDPTSPSIHNFLADGNGDSQVGPPDSQLDSQLLAGKRARMAISQQRSPFSRCIFSPNLKPYLANHHSRTFEPLMEGPQDGSNKPPTPFFLPNLLTDNGSLLRKRRKLNFRFKLLA